jgi:hypothetical protein
MAPGPGGRGMVLFGGRGDAPAAETWEWSGSGWTLRRPATAPPPRTSGVMAYDPATGHTLLFGGMYRRPQTTGAPTQCGQIQCSYGVTYPVQFLGDTWLWNGTTWQERHPIRSPDPGSARAITADPAMRAVVLTAITPASGSPAGSGTWTWDGSVWSRVSSQQPPDGAIAFDAASGHLVAFDGQRPQHLGGPMGPDTLGHASTSIWDGAAWTSLSSGAPEFAAGQVAAEPVQGGVLLFNEFGHTWAWSGDRWTQLHPATSPPADFAGRLITNPTSGRVELISLPGGTPALWSWDGHTWTRNGS